MYKQAAASSFVDSTSDEGSSRNKSAAVLLHWSVLRIYFVHQTARLKASQQHIPNQSKHSFRSSRFRFSTPSPCRSGLRVRLGRLDRQISRLRPLLVRAGRAGRAGLRRSALSCCQTEGASEGRIWNLVLHDIIYDIITL
jgi:hypothetical protein